MAKIRQYHHHFHFSYTTSIKRHLLSIAIVTILSLVILYLVIRLAAPQSTFNIRAISWVDIFLASVNTLMRLFIAYIFSVIIAIPLALLITSTPKIEKILLPIFDIIQAIPIRCLCPPDNSRGY